MAIVEMKRMSLLAPAQDEQALLGALQRLSCVHITEPQEEADGFDRQSAPAQLPGLDDTLSRLKWAIDRLGRFDTTKKPLFSDKPSITSQEADTLIQSQQSVLMNVVSELEALEREALIQIGTGNDPLSVRGVEAAIATSKTTAEATIAIAAKEDKEQKPAHPVVAPAAEAAVVTLIDRSHRHGHNSAIVGKRHCNFSFDEFISNPGQEFETIKTLKLLRVIREFTSYVPVFISYVLCLLSRKSRHRLKGVCNLLGLPLCLI